MAKIRQYIKVFNKTKIILLLSKNVLVLNDKNLQYFGVSFAK